MNNKLIELIDSYAKLIRAEGLNVQIDQETFSLSFKLDAKAFYVTPVSKQRYTLNHKLLGTGKLEQRDYPRVLDAVNLSNILYPNVRACAFGGTITLAITGETDAVLGLSSLKSRADDILEAAVELAANISNPSFAYFLKKA